MQKYKDSTFNFFTPLNLNRSSEKRINDEWIKEKLHDEKTRIITAIELKFIFNDEPETKTVFINSYDLKNLRIPYEKFIYLGENEDINYFCIDSSDDPELSGIISKRGQLKELRNIAALIDREVAAILAYARALIYWHNNNKFCGKCGTRLIVKDAGHKLKCPNPECAAEHFPRTDPAVIMLVEKDGKCLLARQAKWPKKRYSTIAGFVEPGESLEQAVQREVFEETGVYVGEIVYHSSQPWPFPASIMLGFRAIAESTAIKLGDNELEEAGWFSREDIIVNVNKGILDFPPPISVSYRLIKDWFDEGSPVSLEKLIDPQRYKFT